MNDKPLFDPPAPDDRAGWLDAYMPDSALVEYQPRQKLIDAAVLRGAFFRQRWLIASIVILALAGGLIITLLTEPMYEARAKVRVEPYGATIVDGQDVASALPTNQITSYLETLLQVIKSRSLAETVADDLNLQERTSLLGPDFEASRPDGMSDEEFQRARREAAVQMLSSSVYGELATGTFVVEIHYRSEDPGRAAEFANAYAKAFIASDTRGSVENNQYALEYLKEQIDETRARLAEAERNSNSYARDGGIFVDQGAENGAGGTLTASNLSNINARYVDAKAERIAAEQRWRAVANLPATQLSDAQNNVALQSLVSQRAEKEAELISLRRRYNDQFPQIVDLLSQIELLDQQIERSSRDIKAAIRNQYIVARSQEEGLARELASLRSETVAEQEEQVGLGILERDADALRAQLTVLLSRYNEINSAAEVDPGKFELLDSALVPKSPVSPSLVRNMGLALAFGLAMAAGLAVLREAFDDRIRNFEEFEDKLGIPLFGHTPFLSQTDLGKDEGNQFSSLVEAYASIQAAISFSIPRHRNVLQLTSSEASEGKSTSAVILAEIFARQGLKTLLVDADLRKPAIAQIIDFEKPKAGLVEFLLGHINFEQAITKGVHENLDILPIAEVPTNPSEMISSPEFHAFLEKYRNEYSLILLDSSPVLGLADAPLLANIVDGTIFVVEAGRSPFSKVRTALRRIKASNGKLIGGILTKYRALEAGQSYDYQYDYYRYGHNK